MTDIMSALHFATERHRGQTRKFNGEDYVQHCVRVADSVSQHTDKHKVIVAAILHDTLEDTETTQAELVQRFGEDVASLVLALTNDEEEMAKVGGKRAYLANKINTLASDELLIKLADRLDNTSDLQSATNKEWSRKYCEETRHIFLETLRKEKLATEGHIALLKKIEKQVLLCERELSQ